LLSTLCVESAIAPHQPRHAASSRVSSRLGTVIGRHWAIKVYCRHLDTSEEAEKEPPTSACHIIPGELFRVIQTPRAFPLPVLSPESRPNQALKVWVELRHQSLRPVKA
jgi:hypothetical protein